MLFDSLTVAEVVDADSAHEFLKEATRLARSEDLEDCARRLQRKHALFRDAFQGPDSPTADPAALERLTSMVFGLRRKAAELVAAHPSRVQAAIRDLLQGQGDPPERLERFERSLPELESSWAIAWGSELLHFTSPESCWLWTRWVWDPGTNAGALPLVLQDTTYLGGKGTAERYRQVGQAMDRVNAAGHAQGFAELGPGPFGTDVFLACVYAVYMFTVFRMKLSKEFNRILPELPELTRRILGVQHLEAA
jgi:hypothetical protein